MSATWPLSRCKMGLLSFRTGIFERILLSFKGLSLRLGDDCDESGESGFGVSLGVTASRPDVGGSGK